MGTINLTLQEKEWVEILGDFNIGMSDPDPKLKLHTAELLANSLLDRKAIPAVRLSYFIEPEYNLSNTKKSRQEVFEGNNTEGDAILSHPHFLEYLKYFIYGANLPGSLKTQLIALKQNHHYDDDFIEGAIPLLKGYFKNTPYANRSLLAEEAFKACLDLGIELIYSKHLRDKILKWR